MSQNPAEEPETHIVRLSDEALNDLKAAAKLCLSRALAAQEWGLATRYHVALEILERA
jgi:hypothetical protein